MNHTYPHVPHEPVLFHSDTGTKNKIAMHYVVNVFWIVLGVILLFSGGILQPILRHLVTILYLIAESGYASYYFPNGLFPILIGEIFLFIWAIIWLSIRLFMLAAGIYCLVRNIQKSREMLVIMPKTISGTDEKGYAFTIPVSQIRDVAVATNKWMVQINPANADTLYIQTDSNTLKLTGIRKAHRAADIIRQLMHLPQNAHVMNTPPAPTMPAASGADASLMPDLPVDAKAQSAPDHHEAAMRSWPDIPAAPEDYRRDAFAAESAGRLVPPVPGHVMERAGKSLEEENLTQTDALSGQSDTDKAYEEAGESSETAGPLAQSAGESADQDEPRNETF